jgi:hypothetical protein
VAQVSASAALTGLIFVVLSFNFDQIVGDKVWLGRAGTGLVLLAQPTIYGLIGLFPTRTVPPVAWALAATALTATTALARIVLATTEHTPARQVSELASRLSFTLAGSLAAAAGALALAAGWPGGTFILAAGALISLAIGLVTAGFCSLRYGAPRSERSARWGSAVGGTPDDVRAARTQRGRSTVTQRVSSRAGAPPSPRALPSFQAGCSRQRESSSVRGRAGLPMLLREVSFLEGHSGSPHPGLVSAVAGVAASGGQRTGIAFMRPAEPVCSRRRWRGPRPPGG